MLLNLIVQSASNCLLKLLQVHSKGLKFGLYQDWGEKTCAGYPGVLGNEESDIKQFVEWEVDYIKLDGCYSNVRDMDRGKITFYRRLVQHYFFHTISFTYYTTIGTFP